MDARAYIHGIEDFTNKYVANFYLEVARDRMMFGQGTQGFVSAQHTILDVLNCLMMETSPVLIQTSQEVFQHMPASLFCPKAGKPLTVFQLPWPSLPTSSSFHSLLANFVLRSNFIELLDLRLQLKPQLEDVAHKLRAGLSAFDLTFIIPQPDNPLATTLETVLDDEVGDFFFGCNISVATATEDDKRRSSSNMPRACRTPARVIKLQVTVHEEDGEQSQEDVVVRVYRQRKKNDDKTPLIREP